MECQLAVERPRFLCAAIGSPPYMNGSEQVAGPWVDKLELELAGYDVAGVVNMGGKQIGLSMFLTGYD